jgi:isopentenyl-diphosphate delta-isomerase
MPDSGATEQRKAEHLRISLEEDVEFKGLPTGFECYRFVHQALPEIDLAEVDPSIALFGKRLRAPLLVSSMTGGAAETERINKNLAIAAQAMGIGMGLGSQRRPTPGSHLPGSRRRA